MYMQLDLSILATNTLSCHFTHHSFLYINLHDILNGTYHFLNIHNILLYRLIFNQDTYYKLQHGIWQWQYFTWTIIYHNHTIVMARHTLADAGSPNLHPQLHSSTITLAVVVIPICLAQNSIGTQQPFSDGSFCYTLATGKTGFTAILSLTQFRIRNSTIDSSEAYW